MRPNILWKGKAPRRPGVPRNSGALSPRSSGGPNTRLLNTAIYITQYGRNSMATWQLYKLYGYTGQVLIFHLDGTDDDVCPEDLE